MKFQILWNQGAYTTFLTDPKNNINMHRCIFVIFWSENIHTENQFLKGKEKQKLPKIKSLNGLVENTNDQMEAEAGIH